MLTISEITKKIKKVLESEVGEVELIGEISNYVHHQSGHKYFVLKDNDAQISAVMWASSRINFIPKNGMKVIVRGAIEIYPPQGKYQIICRSMIPAGQGDLYLAFEALKLKLQEKGYFAQDRKRSIPKIPYKVGISTSPTGAAIHDMVQTIKRRNKLIQIYFRPTLVQGDGSAEDIVKAINELNTYNCDVIIIGRGGGSIEDLWSYNTEIVANAIYNSKTPIISAVGHESDFTISDFVADNRASTPTAAAEIVSSVPLSDIDDFIGYAFDEMSSIIQEKIDFYIEFLDSKIEKNLSKPIKEKINLYKQTIDYKSNYIDILSKNMLKNKKSSLENLDKRLSTNNPLLPLNKGYAILKNNGLFIENKHSLNEFSEIDIVRKNEIIKVKIGE